MLQRSLSSGIILFIGTEIVHALVVCYRISLLNTIRRAVPKWYAMVSVINCGKVGAVGMMRKRRYFLYVHGVRWS